MHTIREYRPDQDATALRTCFVELQNFERGLEPTLPEGEAVADAYLASMLAHCAEWSGKVFVADVDSEVVGFVSIWATVQQTELDEAPTAYAYISDLVVLPTYRGRGLGRALLQQAEEYAHAQGATVLKIGVLTKNLVAWQLYRGCGFRDYRVELVKNLEARARRL